MNPLTTIRERRLLIAFLGVALLIRLVVWYGGLYDQSRYMEPDSADYLRLSSALIVDHKFGTESEPEIFRVPGYPAFLSAVSLVSDSPVLPCLIQIIFDVGTCFLLWYLTRAFFSKSAALVAVGFQSISVVSVIYASKILSDTLFTFCLVLFLSLILKIWKTPEVSIGTAILCGIVLSVMAYLRAITLLYLYLPIIFLVYRKKLKSALIVTGLTAFLLLPWYTRNMKVASYPHFSSVGAINLYRYNACLLLAHRNGIAFNEQQGRIDAEFADLNSQRDVAVYAAQRAKKIILDDPMRYVFLHLKADINTLLPASGQLVTYFGAKIGGTNTLNKLNSEGIVAAVKHYFHGQWWLLFVLSPTVFVLGTAYLSATFGVVNQLKQWKALDPFVVLLILSMIYFLLVPGAASHPRFRVPASPFISLFAGVGSYAIYQSMMSKFNTKKSSV